MSRRPVRVEPRLKQLLYGLLGLLWVTGAVWLYYGAQMHPVKNLCLEIHGAAAMGLSVLLGVFLHEHVPKGWQQKDHRPTGVGMLGACGLLILTGWGLYYLGSERLRLGTHWIHSILGLLLPVIVFVHVRQAQSQAKNKSLNPTIPN